MVSLEPVSAHHLLPTIPAFLDFIYPHIDSRAPTSNVSSRGYLTNVRRLDLIVSFLRRAVLCHTSNPLFSLHNSSVGKCARSLSLEEATRGATLTGSYDSQRAPSFFFTLARTSLFTAYVTRSCIVPSSCIV